MISRYDTLAVELVCLLDGEDLPMPDAGMIERNEQRVCIAVCEAMGMKSERWDSLNHAERMPYLMKTLEKLRTVKPRKGRPRATETGKGALVLAALAQHHQYEPGGSIGNYDPAGVNALADATPGLTSAAISRFFKSRNMTHTKYAAACRRKEIGRLLAEWSGDDSEGHAALRDDDSDD